MHFPSCPRCPSPAPTCTQWRDPFFVPPQLDPGTGQPLPGQENRLQVPPAIARTPAVPAAVAAGNEQGGNSTGTNKAVPAAGCKDGQASQGGGGGTQVEAGAQAGGPQQSLPGLQATGEGGPQVLKDNDGFVMIIGSGHEGVGGTALVYRSKDLHKGGVKVEGAGLRTRAAAAAEGVLACHLEKCCTLHRLMLLDRAHL